MNKRKPKGVLLPESIVQAVWYILDECKQSALKAHETTKMQLLAAAKLPIADQLQMREQLRTQLLYWDHFVKTCNTIADRVTKRMQWPQLLLEKTSEQLYVSDVPK